MIELTAKPLKIEEVFRREYLIPEYQRPYSWERNQCERLVEDITSFYKDNTDNKAIKYFLGSIVIAKGEEEKGEEDKWLVIDGQQRLTTLLLFIKALHRKDLGHKALEACYKKSDRRTGNFVSELRLVSEVIEGDKENLAAVLLDKEATSQNRFSSNFEHISNMLNDKDKMLWDVNSGPDFEDFIATLLDRVVLLPVECDGLDSALTIFDTLNNRGMQLTDADIFKANLYRKLQPQEKENFVNDWKDFMSDDGQEQNGAPIVELFRIYMHVLRAQEKDTTKEKALRAYFLNPKSDYFDKPFEVMDGLKKCKAVDSWESCSTITIWWSILHTYPNKVYWKYPLYVFLHKYLDEDEGEGFVLEDGKKEEFVSLIESTVRYCYIKGVVTNSVNSIKDTIFKVCAAIAHEEDYRDYYIDNSDNDIEEFYRKLDNKDFGRYRKGLILINSALHASLEDDDNRHAYSDFLMKAKSITIEHILPKKWNNYDGWDELTYKKDIDKLGNLIPCEKEVNSKASNEFFSRKKETYLKSGIAEVRTLCDLDKWSPESLEQRDRDVRERLKQFFSWGKSKG